MKHFLASASLLIALPLTAAVMTPAGPSSQIVIPAAGSAAGANGTFFRSDIMVANFASHDQQVSLQWLPQGTSGSGIAAKIVTVHANSVFRSADFVSDYLGQTGLGAIVISGITTSGQLDNTATLSVSSRIWTPQPGSAGTTSQSFPAIPLSAINAPANVVLLGLGGEDARANYRVNAGIVNLDPINDQTFLLTTPSINQVVVVHPMSMQQVLVAADFPPTDVLSIQNTTTAATRSSRWIAYGSTVDNITGDAWSEIAAAP